MQAVSKGTVGHTAIQQIISQKATGAIQQKRTPIAANMSSAKAMLIVMHAGTVVGHAGNNLIKNLHRNDDKFVKFEPRSPY